MFEEEALRLFKRHTPKDFNCLFNWDEVPGKDSERALKFLRDNLKVDWLENAEIKKSDGDRVITITKENNSLIFKLNKEENKVILEIKSGETYEYTLKEEGNKLNIYDFKIIDEIKNNIKALSTIGNPRRHYFLNIKEINPRENLINLLKLIDFLTREGIKDV